MAVSSCARRRSNRLLWRQGIRSVTQADIQARYDLGQAVADDIRYWTIRGELASGRRRYHTAILSCANYEALVHYLDITEDDVNVVKYNDGQEFRLFHGVELHPFAASGWNLLI